MNQNQLHIIQHSLGCDKYGLSQHRGKDEGDGCFGYYRNRYVCDPTPDLIELCDLGFMEDDGPQSIAGGMHHYHVTENGLHHMRVQCPKKPALTKSQRRYQAFLDADSGMSFGEYIKGKFFEKYHA